MITFRQNFTTPHCVLSRDDLVELTQIAERDFPPDHRLLITTETSAIHISAENIQDFIDNENLPDTLKQFSMLITERENYTKSISIQLLLDFEVNINGNNEAWVLGRRAQLENFFVKRISKDSRIRKIKNIFRSLIFTSIMKALIILIIIQFTSNHDMIYNIPFAASLIYISQYALNKISLEQLRLSHVQIRRISKSISIHNRAEIIGLILAIITLLVTLIQTYFTIFPSIPSK